MIEFPNQISIEHTETSFFLIYFNFYFIYKIYIRLKVIIILLSAFSFILFFKLVAYDCYCLTSSLYS